MNNKYITPEMEISVLDNADIITSSIGENETDMVPFNNTSIMQEEAVW